MNGDDIYEILDAAYETDDQEEFEELVERALEIDPDHPVTLFLKSDLIEEDEERLSVLDRALEQSRQILEEEGGAILEEELGLIHLGLLQRAAFTCFSLEMDDRALELTEEFLSYEDNEDREAVLALYYRILLERKEWSRVIEETMKDEPSGLGWLYARIAAFFMLSGAKGERESSALRKLNEMLWEAVSMSPNAPFYMLGYEPDPVDESEDEQEAFHFALLYEDVWSASREMLNWFSKSVIIFGLLSGRFGGESCDMEEILDALGGTQDYKALSKTLADAEDDDTILDALSDGAYPTKI